MKSATTALSKPEAALSTAGYQFDPASTRWQLSRDIVLRLQWLDKLAKEPLRTGFLKTLCHYAVTYSPAHAFNVCERLRALLRTTFPKHGRLDWITPPIIINYKAILTRRTEWKLCTLRGFFRKWIVLGFGGVDSEAMALLDTLRLRTNLQGEAVRIRCPYRGALSHLENDALHHGVIDAFETGVIVLDDFVLIILFAATGRRPVQIGDLKHVDLMEVRSEDGLSEFVLNVPRRKQRGVSWRGQFKPVALTTEIGQAVKTLIEQNVAKLGALYPNLHHQALNSCPLFPNWRALEESKGEYNLVSDQLLKADVFHSTTESLRNRLESNVRSLSIPSERTGKPLHISPVRLRRNVATNAAKEGYGSLAIAEILDHSDDTSARIYTENVPEHVDAINAAVAHQLAPIAQAFVGILVDSEERAIRGGDRASRIRTDTGAGAGNCGKFGFCGACAPIACYTCRHFQPWLNGAHQEVLEILLSERNRIMDQTRDSVMASVNDRTIIAVSEVIRRCETRHQN